MLPQPLTNFEIPKYKNELKFNELYWRNKYVINLDEYKSIGTHWKALYLMIIL